MRKHLRRLLCFALTTTEGYLYAENKTTQITK